MLVLVQRFRLASSQENMLAGKKINIRGNVELALLQRRLLVFATDALQGR
jgi:hypothetical protein